MIELAEIDLDAPGFADYYDELPLWSAPFGQLLLSKVPLKAGQTVLDVGAGAGWLTIEMAERCGGEARVIAVDPWKPAMDRLRRKASYRGLSNIETLEMDASSLPIPDSSVDVIVSNLGINNFDQPDVVFAECFRVARPGATLVVTTNLAGHMREFYAVFNHVLGEVGQADRRPALQEHIDYRGTVSSVSARIDAAGFTVTETETDSFLMRYANGTALLNHYFIRFGFLPSWKAIVLAESVDETFDALEKKLNALADSRGSLDLSIPIACIVATK